MTSHLIYGHIYAPHLPVNKLSKVDARMQKSVVIVNQRFTDHRKHVTFKRCQLWRRPFKNQQLWLTKIRWLLQIATALLRCSNLHFSERDRSWCLLQQHRHVLRDYCIVIERSDVIIRMTRHRQQHVKHCLENLGMILNTHTLTSSKHFIIL